MKNRGVFILGFVLLIGIFSFGVIAQEGGVEVVGSDGVDTDGVDVQDGVDDFQGESVDSDSDDVDDFSDEIDESDLDEEDEDELDEEDGAIDLDEIERDFEGEDVGELRDAGITPDSAFAFVDDFFDRFGDELDVKEEKIAEIKEMIREGDPEAARRALDKYKERSEEFESKVGPERKEEVRESAVRIKKSLREIEGELNEEDRREFIDEVLEVETEHLTTIEIRGKIVEFCEELQRRGEFDFDGCFGEGDGQYLDDSEWFEKQRERWTDEQRVEAEVFIEEIGSCMENPSDCDCDAATDIEDFVLICERISSAEAACREGNEDACGAAEDVGDEVYKSLSSAPHLLDALRRLESRFEEHSGERFEVNPEFFEREFRKRAPPACIDALENGEIDLSDGPFAVRRQCEEIAFESEAPIECIEEGIDNPRDCANFMREHGGFEERFREERREEFRGNAEPPDFAPAIGLRCREIEDAGERLKCFDAAHERVRTHYEERFEERRRDADEERIKYEERFEFRQEFGDDFDEEEYKRRLREEYERHFGDDFDEARFEERFDEEEGEFRESFEGEFEHEGDFGDFEGEDFEGDFGDFDPAQECEANGGSWDGSNCVFEGNFDNSGEGSLSPEEEFEEFEESFEPEPEPELSPEPEPEPSPEPEPEPSPTTASVITGNAFLDYYFGYY